MVRQLNRWHLALVILLIAGPLWIWVNRAPIDAQAQSSTPEPAVGRLAPDVELVTLDGLTFSLHGLRGTPVVVNFWATWCGPCIREMPALQAAAERYAGRVVIAGVDQGENPEVVANFIKEMGVTFPIPMDADFAVGDRYNVKGLPTTFFVDEYGYIRHLWVGEMNAIVLAEGIAKIWP
jgi:cytochrome c biogenesis protein CcmG, thiol:disulfide interchange protein DsbE